MTYHFVYKTINAINNRYYIGVHSTDNLNDGYLGSGKALKNAINKYGKSNFFREIVKFHNTREDAILHEKSLVNKKTISDAVSYNMTEGGGDPPSRKGKVSPNTLLLGENRTPSQKKASKLHSTRQKNKPAHNRKKVILFGVEYNSIREAMKENNLSTSIFYWMEKNDCSSFNSVEEVKDHIWKQRNKKISSSKKGKKPSKNAIKKMVETRKKNGSY